MELFSPLYQIYFKRVVYEIKLCAATVLTQTREIFIDCVSNSIQKNKTINVYHELLIYKNLELIVVSNLKEFAFNLSTYSFPKNLKFERQEETHFLVIMKLQWYIGYMEMSWKRNVVRCRPSKLNHNADFDASSLIDFEFE
jgi:hypothetical protein